MATMTPIAVSALAAGTTLADASGNTYIPCNLTHVLFNILTLTATDTLAVDGTIDGGVNWLQGLSVTPVVGGAAVTSITAPGGFMIQNSPFTGYRIRKVGTTAAASAQVGGKLVG